MYTQNPQFFPHSTLPFSHFETTISGPKRVMKTWFEVYSLGGVKKSNIGTLV